jgi:hypothetical protein
LLGSTGAPLKVICGAVRSMVQAKLVHVALARGVLRLQREDVRPGGQGSRVALPVLLSHAVKPAPSRSQTRFRLWSLSLKVKLALVWLVGLVGPEVIVGAGGAATARPDPTAARTRTAQLIAPDGASLAPVLGFSNRTIALGQ